MRLPETWRRGRLLRRLDRPLWPYRLLLTHAAGRRAWMAHSTPRGADSLRRLPLACWPALRRRRELAAGARLRTHLVRRAPPSAESRLLPRPPAWQLARDGEHVAADDHAGGGQLKRRRRDTADATGRSDGADDGRCAAGGEARADGGRARRRRRGCCCRRQRRHQSACGGACGAVSRAGAGRPADLGDGNGGGRLGDEPGVVAA
eukprot:4799229-Prymnesium_polylepis.1